MNLLIEKMFVKFGFVAKFVMLKHRKATEKKPGVDLAYPEPSESLRN